MYPDKLVGAAPIRCRRLTSDFCIYSLVRFHHFHCLLSKEIMCASAEMCLVPEEYQWIVIDG
jgi:hypothetical protein